MLSTKPFFAEGHVQLPPLTNVIILWGVVNGRLAKFDIVEVDDRVTFLRSDRTQTFHSVIANGQRIVLLQLIARIQQGKEPVIAESK